VTALAATAGERSLILAPRGRDATVAGSILGEAAIASESCADLPDLMIKIDAGADLAIITEEALRHADLRDLAAWVAAQPPWSDFPFVILTGHGGGLERNPEAEHFVHLLGNLTFIERPFHPMTLISVVRAGLRSRQRQYECRRLNEQLESRVEERTSELGAANRQLLAQIAEREKVEATLRQMQRLEAVGQLTSGVAHDFNNLLTVVLGNVEVLEGRMARAGSDKDVTRRLGSMRIAAERGAKLTDQLLAFSRRQRLEPKVVDLNQAVGAMRDLLQSTMGGTIAIETREDPELWSALVDPTQIELAVLNLAINARDAMEIGGRLTVETFNETLGDPRRPEEPAGGDYVAVRVRDTGTGMTPEVREKVFEPFFTTKEIGKGSGLGLSQVLGFAKQSGGGVRIESRPGQGTAVSIYLPRADALAQLDAPPREDAEATPARSATILLVDDDNSVREVTAAMLRDLGYQVEEAGSGGAALDLLQRSRKFDLLLVDFAMPGMSGADFVRQARIAIPLLPALYVTGFADRTALAGIGESEIVGKPFHIDELARKVRAALAKCAGVAD
jgi:signal transduction histidine kinase/ActR/RegA family two-component response regulator